MSNNGASAKAMEVYHNIIKRERLSGLLWVVWAVLTLGGGIVWKVLFKSGIAEYQAAFEAAMVEGGRTWAQHAATISFISGALIFVGKSITVVSESEQARVASSLGVELGVLKGGEKIGN